MTKIELTGDVQIQVYDESGLNSLSLKAGTVSVDDAALALLTHYASSSFTVVDEAPAAVDPAPALAVVAPAVDEPKDA